MHSMTIGKLAKLAEVGVDTVRFYERQRCRETLKGLRVTKANIKFAEKKRAAILHEIGREIFDYSKHFPESPRCRVFGTNPDRDRTVDQALDPSLANCYLTNDIKELVVAASGKQYYPRNA